MSKKALATGTSPFAHLMASFRGERAEDDKPKKDEDEKDPKAKKKAEEPDTSDEGDDTGVDGDPEPDLNDVVDPDDSLDEDEEASPPGEDDSDPKVRKAARVSRKAADARWIKVMKHSAAQGRVASACDLLANNSRMGARAIISNLMSQPKAEAPAPSGQRGKLDDRMAARPQPKVGADAALPASGDFGAQVRAAMNKVRPAR